MQHEHHRVPVTALAPFRQDFILAGEGNLLKVYSTENRILLKSLPIFESQAVHGIIVDHGANSKALAWGGPLVRVLLLDLSDDKQLYIFVCEERSVHDWILDATFPPREPGIPCVTAVVTAHNALWTAGIHVSRCSKKDATCTTLERLVPGSNCILYSAHVVWLSASCCLIASGTAFGDIIIWSANIIRDEDKIHVQTQTHYTFSAHDGSVFGVHISPDLNIPGLESSRLLASCSDDRTIRLWDISDLTKQSPGLPEIQGDTGFGSRSATDTHAPRCLAKAMGHVSRIWHVRYLQNRTVDNAVEDSNRPLLTVMSFGEDASMITWSLNTDGQSYELNQSHAKLPHSGKHIWSIAMNGSRLATGGADGAIALHANRRITDDVLETACIGLPQSGSPDHFRSYAFISDNALVSTTDHGRIVQIMQSAGTASAIDISQPLLGLRGYSLVAGVPSMAFIAGTDGNVYSYTYHNGHLTHIANFQRKTAGLFACKYSTHGIALLITSVGAEMAQLVLFSDNVADGELKTSSTIPLGLPSDFIVTSFTYDMRQRNGNVLLGSRNGSITVFSNIAKDSSVTITHSKFYNLVHGKEAVTALTWIPPDDTSESSGWVFSTGRDGSFAVHRATMTESGIDLALVHQLSLPFGPNIEGLRISPQGSPHIWGFRSKRFVVYDAIAQREIMTVDCGGAHRNWAFQPDEQGGGFVWTKASRIYRATQSQLPHTLLNSGSHGREIKAVAVSSLGSGPQIIATGAEDTDIKLFELRTGGFKCLQTLRKHNTGIQHLRWSSDVTHLFSSGGFEEFFVWKVSLDIPYIGIGVLCESKHPRSGTSDLRIMGFDLNNHAAPVDGQCSGFEICMAYSDSTVKIWHYNSQTWKLIASADYLTACLTQACRLGSLGFVTAATDGHIARWEFDRLRRGLKWSARHPVHQSAIQVLNMCEMSDGSSLIVTRRRRQRYRLHAC